MESYSWLSGLENNQTNQFPLNYSARANVGYATEIDK
jgi:hypothetical protein